MRNNEVLVRFLTERRNQKVVVRSPSRGRVKDLIKTAEKNAKEALKRFINIMKKYSSDIDVTT